jgi:UDP-N-acetyl-D-mannosaminuronate dehydrogenase
MSKEKVLVVGLGEVGYALYELLKESGEFDVYGFDLDVKRLRKITGETMLPEKVHVMHICYPCKQQEEFIQTTLRYIKSFEPKLTIINSTVPPGTTQEIYTRSQKPVVHSPIRGMHKSLEMMKNDIRFWKKYIGGTTTSSAEAAKDHFEKLGLKVKILKSSIETELAKLFETTYRAFMIACFQEMHRISRHYNADFDQVVDMLEDIHRLRLNKPLHYPGVIGGHCLIPNTELLLSVYDSEFLRLVLKSNEKRKEEIKDHIIFEETEKVRKRAELVQKELMEKLGNS